MNKETEGKISNEKNAEEKAMFSERSLAYKTFYEMPKVLDAINTKDLAIYLSKSLDNCEIWSKKKRVLGKIFEIIKTYDRQTCLGRLDVSLPQKDRQILKALLDEIKRTYPGSSIKKIVDEKQISESNLKLFSIVILPIKGGYIISSRDERILEIVLVHLIQHKSWKLIKGSVERNLPYQEKDWRQTKETLGIIRIREALAPS